MFIFDFIFQGIKDADNQMPEVLSGLFSKATLTKLGLDDNEIELYSGKMDKILEAATIVSYMLATSL